MITVIRNQEDLQAFTKRLRGAIIKKPLKVETTLYNVRTVDQNALMWPLLRDISEQVLWYGKYYTKEDWKDILTAALVKAEIVPGIDGGFVVLGLSTSKMSPSRFSDLIELIFAFGAEHNVKFREPKSSIINKLNT